MKKPWPAGNGQPSPGVGGGGGGGAAGGPGRWGRGRASWPPRRPPGRRGRSRRRGRPGPRARTPSGSSIRAMSRRSAAPSTPSPPSPRVRARTFPSPRAHGAPPPARGLPRPPHPCARWHTPPGPLQTPAAGSDSAGASTCLDAQVRPRPGWFGAANERSRGKRSGRRERKCACGGRTWAGESGVSRRLTQGTNN